MYYILHFELQLVNDNILYQTFIRSFFFGTRASNVKSFYQLHFRLESAYVKSINPPPENLYLKQFYFSDSSLLFFCTACAVRQPLAATVSHNATIRVTNSIAINPTPVWLRNENDIRTKSTTPSPRAVPMASYQPIYTKTLRQSWKRPADKFSL